MNDDTMTQGIIAGIAGAVVQNIYALITRAAGFNVTTYADYARATLFERNYQEPFAQFLGFIGHFTWDILLGVIFVYVIKSTSRKFLTVKSIAYGVVIWYLVKGAPTFFRLPAFLNITPESMFFYFIGSILFGVTISLALKYLQKNDIKV